MDQKSSAGMKTDSSMDNSAEMMMPVFNLNDRIGYLRNAVREVFVKMKEMDMSAISRASYVPENLPAMNKNNELREMLTA